MDPNLSSAPLELLEEIFDDAHIRRTSALTRRRRYQDLFDLYDEGSSFEEEPTHNTRTRNNNNNQRKKRRAHNNSNLSLNQSQRHHHSNNSNNSNSNNSSSNNSSSNNNNGETVHWQALRQENELLRYKIAKLTTSNHKKDAALTKRTSKLHLHDAVSSLTTSLTCVLFISLKQRMQVRAIFFFRWVNKISSIAVTKVLLQNLVSKSRRIGEFQLKVSFYRWRKRAHSLALQTQVSDRNKEAKARLVRLSDPSNTP